MGNVNSSEVCIIGNLDSRPGKSPNIPLQVCTAVVNGTAWWLNTVTCLKPLGECDEQVQTK